MATVTPEGKVKHLVRGVLKGAGITYIKTPTTAGYGTSGDFDMRCLFNGVSIGIECKATDKDMPTTLQTKNAIDHYHAGGISICIHRGNVGILYAIINNVASGVRTPMLYWPDEAMNKLLNKENNDETDAQVV